MLDLSHNVHLVLYLRVDNAILDKASLFQFLSSIGNTVEFVQNFVYDGESTFANG
jgi:hypothetical protein